MLRLRTEALEDAQMRSEMRDLARDFPGALRELDELPFEVIARRLEQVTACARTEPWMIATLQYHRALAEILAARTRPTQGVRAGSIVQAAVAVVAETMSLTLREADDLIFAGLRRRRSAGPTA